MPSAAHLPLGHRGGQAPAAVCVTLLVGHGHEDRPAVTDRLPARGAGPQEHRQVIPRCCRPRPDGVVERVAGDGQVGICRQRAEAQQAADLMLELAILAGPSNVRADLTARG